MARSRFLRYTTENVRHRAHQRVGIRFTLLAALLVTAGCMMLTERALAQQAPVTLGGVRALGKRCHRWRCLARAVWGFSRSMRNALKCLMSLRLPDHLRVYHNKSISIWHPSASTDRRYFSCVRQIRWHRYRHLQVLEPVRVSRGGRLRGRLRAADFMAQPDAGAATFRGGFRYDHWWRWLPQHPYR